jgi:hypothetical protein
MEPAVWIRPPHRTALILTSAFYTNPIKEIDGYVLTKQTDRIGVYQNKRNYIVVCKGTTVTDPRDIFDDLRIGGILNGENTIEAEARKTVSKINGNILICGYSLGGRAALTIAKEFNLQACVFNPVGPFSSPLVDGPGPKNAVAYHIVGDGISSHIDPNAAEVVRVDQGFNVFETLDAHKMANFSTSQPTFNFYSVDQEDVHLYSTIALGFLSLGDADAVDELRRQMRLYQNEPIPGSLRKDRGTSSAIFDLGFGTAYFVYRVGALDVNVRIIQKALGYAETGILPKRLKNITKDFQLIGDMVSASRGGVRNLESLSNNVRNMRFLQARTDLARIQDNVAEMQRIGREIQGRSFRFNDSDILFSSNTGKIALDSNQLVNLSHLQSIGMEDQMLASVRQSPLMPNPARYLDEVADNLPPPTYELSMIQNYRIDNPPAYSSFEALPPAYTEFENQLRDAQKANKVVSSKVVSEGTSIRNKVLRETLLVAAQNPRTRKLANVAEKILSGESAAKKVYKNLLLKAAANPSTRPLAVALEKAGVKVEKTVTKIVDKIDNVVERAAVKFAKPIAQASDLISAAKKGLREYATLAAKVGTKVFQVLGPIVAAADIGYTAYLITQAIRTGDWNDVVENLTMFTVDEWKDSGETFLSAFNVGGVFNKTLGVGNDPICDDPALYYDGKKCNKNPCQKRGGKWGVYDPQTNTCTYDVDYTKYPYLETDYGLEEKKRKYQIYLDEKEKYFYETNKASFSSQIEAFFH